MNANKKPRRWLTESEKFSIGSFIIFILAAVILFSGIVGCSAVQVAEIFDAPATPQPATDYISPQSEELVICVYLSMVDSSRWILRQTRKDCKGWTPL